MTRKTIAQYNTELNQAQQKIKELEDTIQRMQYEQLVESTKARIVKLSKSPFLIEDLVSASIKIST